MASEQAAALTVSDHWDGGVAIAVIQGDIDISTVAIFSERLCQLAGKNPQRLVIDLAGVSFIDSSGLGGFVRVRKALPPDCPLVLRSPQSRIRRLFKITGLDPVFVFE